MALREIPIEIDGTVYWAPASNKLFRRIDAELHPATVYGTLGQFQDSQLPFPALAFILAKMLEAAGAPKEFDEDYMVGELQSCVANGEMNRIKDLMRSLAEAIATPGNSQASASSAATPGRGSKAAKRPAAKKRPTKKVPATP